MLRILDKPAGLTTHTSLSSDERGQLTTDPVDSFLGHLSYRSGIELWPVHRLDRGTTGVMIAADTPDDAALLSQTFESREVEKTYFFLTDGTPSENSPSQLRVESFIDRQPSGGRASNFFSVAATEDAPTNAITDFEFVEKHEHISMWKAKPTTGRPHQIRLHAESLGIPILGDNEHGGSSFPAICLHAAEIRIPWKSELVHGISELPRWFKDLSLASDISKSSQLGWLIAIERRERLGRSLKAMGLAPSPTQRWLHKEGNELSVDQLGDVVQFHWYGENFESYDHKAINELSEIMGWKNWFLQRRDNRGKNPNVAEFVLSDDSVPQRWTAEEDGAKYTFRRDSGLSSGLFLDQRANRRWLKSIANGKSVLNLFSYTGGFSVAAALGGAKRVVTVDLSKNFIAWSKENFEANGLTTETTLDQELEFRAFDAREYLKWARKKGFTFDIVVCDPPSFSRSDNGVFRIEKDFENLLLGCLDVLGLGGTLLFSTNYELLKEEDFFVRADTFVRGQNFASSKDYRLELSRAVSPDLDFEFPREEIAMKSLRISKIRKEM